MQLESLEDSEMNNRLFADTVLVTGFVSDSGCTPGPEAQQHPLHGRFGKPRLHTHL